MKSEINRDKQVNFIVESKYYRFTKRRCASCNGYGGCLAKIKWDSNSTWLEPARTGCRTFYSDDIDLMNERPLTSNDKD